MNRKILQAAAVASALVYCGTAAAQGNTGNTANTDDTGNATSTPAPATATPSPAEATPTPAAAAPSAAQAPVQVRGEQVGPKRKPPNRPMLIAGATLLGLSYVPSVIAGIQSTRGADHLMYLPVVGPWLDLGNRSCTPAEPCTNEGISAALLVIDGAAQLAGGVLMAASFFVPQRAAQVTTTVGGDNVNVQITPAGMGVGGWGLAAVGDF